MVGPSGNDQPTSASNDAKDRLIRPSADELGALRERVGEERRSSALHSARGLSSYRNCPAFGLLQHAAEQLPDRLALIYGNARWTYRDLNSDAVRAAAMLQRLGVRPGDRVGLLLPNVPEYIIAANAIWRAGGIVLAISPLMVPGEVDALLRKTKCRHVICLDLLSNLLPDSSSKEPGRESPLRTTLLVSIRKQLPAHEQLGYLIKRGYQWLQARPQSSSNRVGWFWEEISTIERAWQPITIDPASDPAYILPTGGTTGSPKAVTLSHQNLVANAWQQYVWTRRSFGEETMLGVLPFFHSYGMSATVMGGAAMAATLVLHHRFNTNKTIQLIETHRPSVFHAVPAMLVAMNARLREFPSDKLDSLRWIISGGASLEESVAREFTEHCRHGHDENQHQGPQVVEGFGLSEASPVTHVGHLFHEPIYGRIGLPLPMTECRIVDANADTDADINAGEPETIVADGEVGELCVRGPQVMLGYWGDHDATRLAIRDGWLHTGDLAIRHDDGWYSIVGRKKDLIITSGFNVYPSEVESVLCLAENVKDAAVVAMPDEVRGEAVHAFIVTVDGSPPDIEALEEHCRNHLSAHKRPRAYTHCPDDLPRNFLGKVIRRELRETQAIDN
ncbi:Long-chain-fatty-acid--CoA ligase [Stieleria neptunia]|uniref:Long-chain-fatty-acid--CoA ligase n=1 Tax=Stieleria neptunia TaxID=2527979 RepID=A0A518HW05_9BACT|nr:AMP-binding protein [Stieleria neptunia]QDV45040.1 Long-chain-fatty-acid--CoA ligase [Stieleria neptunia]